MDKATWLVEGIDLDSGEPTELAITDGNLAAGPVSGAERLPGRFVLGGLVDAHCHLSLDFGGQRPPGTTEVVVEALRANLHAGVLLARDVGAPVGVRLGGDHDDGPLVLAAGRFLAPPHGYLPWLFEGVPAEAVAQVALEELAASGSGWVKLVFDFPEHFTGLESLLEAVPNYPPEVAVALCRAVHEAGGRVAAHVSGPGDAALAVSVGVDSLEHGHDVPLDDLADLGRRGGAWTPTLTTVWRGVLAERPGAGAVEAHYREALAAATGAGVVVLAGTDAGGHGTIAEEIALLASLGLTPTQALASASSAARDYLGQPGLVLGQPADLVTYEDDPRADLNVLRRPAAIIRKGRRIA